MKKLQIALIGIIGAVMVFLCMALGISLSRGIPSAGGGNYSLVQEKKFPAQDIRSLKIDYGKGSSGSTDVLFYQGTCLLYTSPSPRDLLRSRMPSSA